MRKITDPLPERMSRHLDEWELLDYMRERDQKTLLSQKCVAASLDVEHRRNLPTHVLFS